MIKKEVRSIALIVLILVLFSACKQPEMLQKPYVTKDKRSGFQVPYMLPRNIVHVSIDVMRTIHYKGPFASYAEQYLKIKDDVVRQNHTEYSIGNVEVDQLAVADENEQFFIQVDPKKAIYPTMTGFGTIAGINVECPYDEPAKFNSHMIPPIRPFKFTDLSVKPIVDIIEEVSYEYKRIDSNLVRVPKEKTITTVKNKQQMAWSAAKFIATLRENRFRLLAGVSETGEIPESIAERVSELNLLENKYLELFIGHTEVDTLVYHYYFEPEKAKKGNIEEIMFYFNDDTGIKEPKIKVAGIPQSDMGTPIKIIVDQTTHPNGKDLSELDKIIDKGLIYRIAVQANVSVSYDKQELVQKHMPISQWGVYDVLPPSLLIDSGKQVELDINTGQLIRIKQIGQ